MLTLAILNFNGQDTLKESIQSVLDQTTQPDRFVVIDNASTDGSRQIAVDMGIDVVDADNRHQFITGLNLALSLNKDLLFFMQNDVILNPFCLEIMLRNCPAKHFISQPVIYQKDGQIDNSGMDIWWPGFAFRRRDEWWGEGVYEPCGLVTTICFLTDNKDVYYDTSFAPAYMEDLDFRLRTHYPFQHVLIPAARVTHKGNHTFSETYKKLEISRICRKNRMKLVRKHNGPFWSAVTACINVAKEAVDVIRDRWISSNSRH